METPVAPGSKNPVWDPTSKFIFDVLPDVKNLEVSIWDKAQTVMGTTHKKVEVALDVNAFKSQKKTVEEWFPVGDGCTLHMKVRFVGEDVARTIKVKNLKPETVESQLTALFGSIAGGVKQVFLNSKKQKGYVEFNTRPGCIQAMSMNGQYGLVVEPSGKTVDKARDGAKSTMEKVKEHPADTVKDMGKKAMASISGLFGGKKK